MRGYRGYKVVQFPPNFLWGAATSAYQVEGNNVNSDWWEWEKRSGLKETSGEACRHYQLYRQDFALAKSLNHNAHRLSLEWSRIQPQEDLFLQKEIEHYQDVISALIEQNLEPVVTLHHFTNPLWFAKKGGWQNKNLIAYFLGYVKNIVQALAERVHFWVTFNEPMVYATHAYVLGIWPPQKKSLSKAWVVANNLISSHIEVYKLIHQIYQQKKCPSPLVSIAKNIQAFVPCNLSFKNKLAVYLRHKYFNLEFVRRLVKKKSLDFIGINYYARSLVEVEKFRPKNLFLDTCRKNHFPLPKNSLGWDIYPQGLYDLLLEFKRYNLPLFILENGICTTDDTLRWNYIQQHLEKLHRVMAGGLEVWGYIYWSLLDNYEWEKGFGPRFGLIEVDYQTYQRRIRESARKFAVVCANNALS